MEGKLDLDWPNLEGFLQEVETFRIGMPFLLGHSEAQQEHASDLVSQNRGCHSRD